ncbi:hypothetical protein [Seonamhaeicola maritimus]|uniref:hypothetical protein n=1 Tax=Seonamhaeicola maritimus TaxID=2591822 RepID=UPI002493E311|nr:hypothetical protein [Seonamhaeicola maritimus]
MAKLFIKLILLLFFVGFSGAQDTLCVYKSKGSLFLENKGALSPLNKGGLINKNNLVKVLSQAELTAIDKNGIPYNVNVEGKYGFSDLLNFKVKQKTSNLTASYFKYIWEELTHSGDKTALIAGVFRGDLLMTSPKDSCKIASSKVTLKWETLEESELYYVFIRNTKTDEVLKFETNGSHMALYDDNPIFYEGDRFEWAVTTDAFPNLDNTPFFSFNLIDRNTYEEEKLAFQEFMLDLKNVGISENEIETILCETYGLCK